MEVALYGPDGFFTRPGNPPSAHFRTSVLASRWFAEAVTQLLIRLDTALDRPDPLVVQDIGAGRGELLTELAIRAPAELTDRLRLVAVERSARPEQLPERIEWRSTPLPQLTGLLLATEWLDNVPVEVVEVDPAGVARYLLVDPATGAEQPDTPVTGPDADWLARWWPLSVHGHRAEIGHPRDQAWAAAVATLTRGAALAVDYGHTRQHRPPLGTLTGFQSGRQVPPVPDGSRDLTAHVAIDAVAAAGAAAIPAADEAALLLTQRQALRQLGLTAARPPLTRATTDPAGYLAALATAGQIGELTDPTGLGGHHWLLHLVGLDPMALWQTCPPTPSGN